MLVAALSPEDITVDIYQEWLEKVQTDLPSGLCGNYDYDWNAASAIESIHRSWPHAHHFGGIYWSTILCATLKTHPSQMHESVEQANINGIGYVRSSALAAAVYLDLLYGKHPGIRIINAPSDFIADHNSKLKRVSPVSLKNFRTWWVENGGKITCDHLTV